MSRFLRKAGYSGGIDCPVDTGQMQDENEKSAIAEF
jgi:hypothetical protein